MKVTNEIGPPNTASRRDSRWLGFLGGACVLVVLVGWLLPRPAADSSLTGPSGGAVGQGAKSGSPSDRPARAPRQFSGGGPAATAEEIVANKVIQFGRKRRELVHAIARRLNKDVPQEVEAFFDAVAAGNWEE